MYVKQYAQKYKKLLLLAKVDFQAEVKITALSRESLLICRFIKEIKFKMNKIYKILLTKV